MEQGGNFLSFLFGNVNERGELDNAEIDDVLRQTLQASGAGAMLDRFLHAADLVGPEEEGGAASIGDSSSSSLISQMIKPAKDAVDFSAIDEVIEDREESMMEVSYPSKEELSSENKAKIEAIENAASNEKVSDLKEASEEKKSVPVRRQQEEKPPLFDFKPDQILSFTKFISAPGLYDKPVLGRTRTAIRRDAYISSSIARIKPCAPYLDEVSLLNSQAILDDLSISKQDEGEEFRYRALLKAAYVDMSPEERESDSKKPEVVENIEEKMEEEIVTKGAKELDSEKSMFHPITVFDWESSILWDENQAQEEENISASHSSKFSIPDYELIIGDWTDNIVWDENHPFVSGELPVEIPLNDPNLIIDVIRPESTPHEAALAKIKKPSNSLSQPTYGNAQNANMHPFNLSNDRFYEVYRMHQRMGKLQRQNTSKSIIQHSLPALQLKLPFYRRFMSKADLRCFHRPPLKLTAGEVMRFSRIKQLKNRKKLMKGQAITEILQDVEDITLKDNAPYVLFEYSEEYPVMLSNGGMGSMVMNYYRKKEEKDPYIPKSSIGIPQVLEQVDASPFFMFGPVLPGETVQAIKNNLYIAPIYEHKLKNEDFLLIRYTPKSKRLKKDGKNANHNMSRPQPLYFLREIPKAFTVGQQLPLTVVDPPQSRRIKLFIRDRLKVCALRRIKRRGRQAKYPIHHLVNSFHRYHDQSIRKHMKDFAEVIRGPNSTQYLKILPHVPIPSEQEIQKMVTPEIVCVFEALRAGQQRLADIGYGSVSLNRAEVGSDVEDEESKLDDEIQLAPWHTTANFQLAAQQKGMVQVYGSGDPTGRGEGFSFFRFSMKEMFTRPGASRSELEAYYQSQAKTGHKFSITDQQKIYLEELKKVWDRQRAALQSDADIELDHEEIKSMARRNANGMEEDEEQEWRDMMKLIGEDPRNPGSEMNSTIRRETDTHSVQSFSSKNALTSKKALLIKRHINGHWQEEIVTDPHVIHAYLQQKRLLDLSAHAGKYAITLEDDEETKKKKMKLMVKGMKKEVGISTAEVVKMAASRAEEAGSSKRTCKSCGQLGHIKSNRICPDFARNFPEKAKKEAASDTKIVNGKMIIPKLAFKHAEERKAKKIEDEKRKQEEKKRLAEEKARAEEEAKKLASLKRAREAGTSSDEEPL